MAGREVPVGGRRDHEAGRELAEAALPGSRRSCEEPGLPDERGPELCSPPSVSSHKSLMRKARALTRASLGRLEGGDHAQASHRHGGRHGDFSGSRVRPNGRSQPAQRSKSRGHVPAGRQLRAGTGIVVVRPRCPASVASRFKRGHWKHRAPEQRTKPGTDLSSGKPLLTGT